MMTLLSRLGMLAFLVTSQAVQAVEHLRMSTTTSTENSGLMAVLHPVFEKKYDVKIDVIAVGTGKALKIGSRGLPCLYMRLQQNCSMLHRVISSTGVP